MRIFNCNQCGQRLYFENVGCNNCGAQLGFLPNQLELGALEPADLDGLWKSIGSDEHYRMCTNYAREAVCNWMVPAEDPQSFCSACRLNATIPDLSVAGNLELWRAIETEKRRLVYSLLRLGLPIVSRDLDPSAIAFEFLADTDSLFSEKGRVFTGHNQGLVTINIKEADPAERERIREQLDEPYRTLLGHFRHESGHYYWDRLVRNGPRQQECRNLFGDESIDYGQALERYYQTGPATNWQENFISGYATMHPAEDWAETWAHYLHMLDTLETAWQFGIGIQPKTGDDSSALVSQDFDPYREPNIDVLIEHWLPLTYALNSLNRSMGHGHAYPFVVTPNVVKKLGFVHSVLWDFR